MYPERTDSTTTLSPIEIKAFVPAKDFELSKRFYESIGFEMSSQFGDVAYFKFGSCAFLLQDFYEPAHSKNFVMHLLVQEIDSWHKHLLDAGVERTFGAKVTDIQQQPWGMFEFFMLDPSGVLWRIAQAA